MEEDAVGLNMTGLTLEMMGLYQSATQAYEMALSVLKQSEVKILSSFVEISAIHL